MFFKNDEWVKYGEEEDGILFCKNKPRFANFCNAAGLCIAILNGKAQVDVNDYTCDLNGIQTDLDTFLFIFKDNFSSSRHGERLEFHYSCKKHKIPQRVFNSYCNKGTRYCNIPFDYVSGFDCYTKVYSN